LKDVFTGAHNDDVRAYGVHRAGNWAEEIPNILNYLNAFIKDYRPRVRLETIVACAKVKSPEAIKVALKALDKPMDTFLDRALWLAVHATAPQWKKAETLDAFLASLPPKHLAYIVEKESSAELLGTVRTMVTEKGDAMTAETSRALIGALMRKGEPADMLRALKLGQTDQAILDELAEAAAQRGYKAPPGAEPVLMELLEKGTPQQKIAAGRLAGAWSVKRASKLVHGLLDEATGEGKTNLEIRFTALTALARLGEPATTFQSFVVDAQQPWPARTAALTALANAQPALAGKEAAKPFGMITDAETMRAWLTPLLAREPAMTSFAKALEAAPCSAETAKLALTTLNAAGRSDAALTAVFNKILGVKNTLPTYSAEWVATLAAEIKASGDATKGKAVFAAPLSGCIACHQIGKVGGIIGPELDSVGRGVPVELLIEAVVWPQRQIKEGYIATSLALKDGRKLQGYKISEGAADMQLKDLLTGSVSTFAKADITARQESGSLMPEGLMTNMTREELRDLIAYLSSLGR
jgi:putative heme-binding domain-containing protein